MTPVTMLIKNMHGIEK